MMMDITTSSTMMKMEESDCIIVEADGSTSSSASQHQPSRLAEIIAHKVKIKQEKIQSSSLSLPFPAATSQQHVQNYLLQHQLLQPPHDEIELVPKSYQEIQIVSQLRKMGFNNNDREIMVALRAIEKKRNISLSQQQQGGGFDMNAIIDDIMLYIVTQREERDEARKMDIAREQSEANVAQEQMMHKSSMNLIYQSLSIHEIIGDTSSSPSQYFPSSNILKVKQAHEKLQKIIQYDDSNHTAKMKIINLLTLESKAYKWFGYKIPYAYFGIEIPDRICTWGVVNNNAGGGDKCTSIILHELTEEIRTIENAMYTLSEQVAGDLGLMIPKRFVDARNDAISKGLIIDLSKKNDVIVLDDDDDN